MATQSSVTVADLQCTISQTKDVLAGEPAPDRAETLRALRDLHEVLMRTTPSSSGPPTAELEDVAALLAAVPADVTDALAPRPRTVYRLLRAETWDAAWQVLIDNAIGVVDEGFDASTATGQPRAAGRLPLLTRIEPPAVFAELPGFRDPRYDVPDDCYDLSGSIRLKHHLDEVSTARSAVTLAGWADLDVLATRQEERVRLILSDGDSEVAFAGRRVRRADLVSGRGEALTRRAWAGWSATVELGDPRLTSGSWTLQVEVDHDGICRRAPIGREASELARAATNAELRVGSGSVRWDTARRRWQLQFRSDNDRG